MRQPLRSPNLRLRRQMQTEDETLRKRRYGMNEMNEVKQSSIAQALNMILASTML